MFFCKMMPRRYLKGFCFFFFYFSCLLDSPGNESALLEHIKVHARNTIIINTMPGRHKA